MGLDPQAGAVSRIRRRIFVRRKSASAASVPVESMFSTAGMVANSKRSSISAERLHRV